MKKLNQIAIILLVSVFAVTFTSCGGGQKKTEEKQKQETKQSVDEFDKLMTHIEQTGDFINSKKVPSMISPKVVKNNLDQNIHIIDIRKPTDYSNGHIPGAVNVGMNQLLDYFMNDINPNSYSHIVMVCYTGQSAGFATSILQLLGYDNVYDMKWGMSSWDKNTAQKKWLKNISNEYADQLETKSNPMSEANGFPTINTGKTVGLEILQERAKELLNKGFKPYTIKAKELFENGDNYYIINYWPEKKYAKGHIPGAIQYNPKKSLGRATQLNTLPTDQTVVPYCFTGQHSAFVTAYLNMIGYDAKSLVYGANSFMNGEMRDRGAKAWHAFTPKRINNFEMATTSGGNTEAAKSEKETDKIQVSGGC
mgnify:CR=1 FL=1